MKVYKLPPGFEELEIALTSLDLTENFKAQEITLHVPAGSEVSLQNPLSPAIPARWIITDIQIVGTPGSVSIARGTAAWSRERLSLLNSGGASANVKILFMR